MLQGSWNYQHAFILVVATVTFFAGRRMGQKMTAWNDGDRPPAKNGQMHAVMETRPEDKIDFRTRAWNRKPAILAIGARGVLRPRSLASPRSRRPKATTSETCSRRGPESLRIIETSLRAKMKRRYTS